MGCADFRKAVPVLGILLALLGAMQPLAAASLNPSQLIDDLNQLVIDGGDLVATIESVTLKPLTMATQLAALETSVSQYLNSVGAVYRDVANASGTISLSNEMLIPLQTLSTISSSLALSLSGLSSAVVVLAPTTLLTTLEASLASMLRLSDDIGVMANRILEMADKILAMADNIGIMADRILATQVIQSDNIKVVVDASLETQKNLLMLFSMLFT